jgi:hypothetical protein
MKERGLFTKVRVANLQHPSIIPILLRDSDNLALQEPTFCLQEKHTRWGETCAS